MRGSNPLLPTRYDDCITLYWLLMKSFFNVVKKEYRKKMTIANSDNIRSHIFRVYVEERTSKENKPYSVLNIEWVMPNEKTYKQTVFLSAEQLALIESSVAKEALL